MPHGPLNGEVSLEIWLRPERIWDYGTFLAFGGPRDPYQFSLRQSQTNLLLQKGVDYGYHRVKLSRLYVRNGFHKGRPVLITVTLGKTNGACIYVDAALTAADCSFPLAATDFNGRLILGDSPGQSDYWSGEIFGFALFRRQLNATEVAQHYSTWQRNGWPHIMADADTIALYLFDEHSGDVVANRTPDGVGLYIPETYVVVDKVFLEPPWMEYGRSEGYWSAVLKNIVGFTPVGFFFLAYLATWLSTGRAVLATLALGTTISFIIELVQAFLPTRESGVTDLITNTIGTGLGTAAYLLARGRSGRASLGFLILTPSKGRNLAPPGFRLKPYRNNRFGRWEP
jgi:hypothetical protein